jgi:ribosomal protein S18 acetylase RimI-like enzyme
LLDVACDRAAAPAAVPDHLSILTADQSHAAGLRALVAEALAQEGQSWSGKPPRHAEAEISIEEIAALIAAQRSRLLVATQGDAIVGCVLVTRQPGARAALGLLGVDPACRRRGLGARLIAAAELTAENEFGSDQIELCVLAEREKLTAYYERFGFALTGEYRHVPLADATMDFVVMVKPLTQAIVA